MEQEQMPKGIVILGRLNFYLFGLFIFLLVVAVFVYLKLIPTGWNNFLKIINESYPGMAISQDRFVIGIIIELIRAVLFMIAGIGVLKIKEWARILTLITGFISAVLIVISVITTPSLIAQGIIQIIYPAILVIYFTNKNVVSCFKQRNNKI